MHEHGKIDVHGLSRVAAAGERHHDHYVIASLNKSMRLHQTNLSIEDDSRVHGRNQGHLFVVAEDRGARRASARSSGTAIDRVVRYFLNDLPWARLGDGSPEEARRALEDALGASRRELERSLGEGEPLATKLTVACVFWPDLYVAHLGECHAYLKRRDEGSLVALDDREPLATEHSGESRPPRSEVRHATLRVGDVLSLLTDGVTEATEEAHLSRVLALDLPAERICERLVAEGASASGAERTAVVVRFVPHHHVDADASEPTAPDPLRAEAERPAPEGPRAAPILQVPRDASSASERRTAS